VSPRSSPVLVLPLTAYQDGTIYLFLRGEHTSLEKLIRFINPIEENIEQVREFHVDKWVLKQRKQNASKWVSRFTLGFSASVPTVTVEVENFHVIPDECKFPSSMRFYGT